MIVTSIVRETWLHVVLLLFVSVGICMPILLNGVPNAVDLPHHFQTAATFVEALRSGEVLPSWSLYRNFGYGGMEARLYPPISHYTLALMYLAFGSWHLSGWLTILLFTFLGSLGTYLWSREYLAGWQSVFAGCLFALLPYHLSQIYNSFFFAEYVGTSVLPFIFLFISRVCRRGRIVDVIGLGLSYSALVLTHLPLTVIGSVCFLIYALALLQPSSYFSQIAKLVCSVLIGLAASSFYWAKVLLERDLLAKTLIYADPWLDYRLHFLVTPIQHFAEGMPLFVYESALLYHDLMFLCLVGLAAAFSLPFIRSAKHRFVQLRGVILVFLAACFFIAPASRFLWDRVTLLQEVQFAWRWVAILSIATPLIVAAGLPAVLDWYRSARRPWAMVITGCLLAVLTYSASQVIRPAIFVPETEIEQKVENARSEIGATFWWPIWAKKEAFETKERVLSGIRASKVHTWSSTEKSIQIEPGPAGDARVSVFYHPGWQARVNGSLVETRPDPNGALLIPIGGDPANIAVSFVESRWVQLAGYISLFTWLACLAFILVSLMQKVRFQNEAWEAFALGR